MPIMPPGRYGKRSRPVRYAKAPLTRFGSILRGFAPASTVVLPTTDCNHTMKDTHTYGFGKPYYEQITRTPYRPHRHSRLRSG